MVIVLNLNSTKESALSSFLFLLSFGSIDWRRIGSEQSFGSSGKRPDVRICGNEDLPRRKVVMRIGNHGSSNVLMEL